MKLSILIPTLVSREKWLERILFNLNWQISKCTEPGEVEVLTELDSGQATTGEKRNRLMERAKGIAIAQFDDDDMPTDVYIQKGLDFANSGMDCASLKGLYFLNGVYDRPFLHSMKYKEWTQDSQFYYRGINHINFYKRELAIQVPYRDITVGEDGNWSYAMRDSGLLKTEYEIKETLYLYYARTKNKGE